jgi:uncharacterized protein YbaR (Trm112 family)
MLAVLLIVDTCMVARGPDFLHGKTRCVHGLLSFGIIQSGSTVMAIDRKLLDILCCPVTKQPVHILGRRELKALNERIGEGQVFYQDDSPVETPLEEGLITANEERVYRVDDGIPVMLEERAINLRAADLK